MRNLRLYTFAAILLAMLSFLLFLKTQTDDETTDPVALSPASLVSRRENLIGQVVTPPATTGEHAMSPRPLPGTIIPVAGEDEGHTVVTGEQARLVLVHVETDKAVYELGEPVLIRRIYRNPGDDPARITAEDWEGVLFGSVGIKSKTGSRLYRPSMRHLEDTLVPPGDQIENVVSVELAEVGEFMIEVPPAYLVRCGHGNGFELRVKIVDHGNQLPIEEKIERLGILIAHENPEWGADGWSASHNALKELGQAVVPKLREWLQKSESPHLRAVSAKILWFVEGRAGIGDLVSGLGDPAAEVRRQCLNSLGSFKAPETLQVILPLIRDRDEYVQFSAIHAACVFEDARVIPALKTALSDEDGWVRTAAASELAKRGDPSGIGHLMRVLEETPAEAHLVVPALEELTKLSFGETVWASLLSNIEKIEDGSTTNENTAKKWLAWWETEGKERFRSD